MLDLASGFTTINLGVVNISWDVWLETADPSQTCYPYVFKRNVTVMHWLIRTRQMEMYYIHGPSKKLCFPECIFHLETDSICFRWLKMWIIIKWYLDTVLLRVKSLFFFLNVFFKHIWALSFWKRTTELKKRFTQYQTKKYWISVELLI